MLHVVLSHMYSNKHTSMSPKKRGEKKKEKIKSIPIQLVHNIVSQVTSNIFVGVLGPNTSILSDHDDIEIYYWTY
jgi:hypothetical protein